jgi:hypothetical protein
MQAKKLILQDYQVEWILDDMPSSTAFYTSEVKTRRYRSGFPLGQVIVSLIQILMVTSHVAASKRFHSERTAKHISTIMSP